MSELVLVRHGQASFLSSNYDQLSALGESQAALLGKYWAERDVQWHRVWRGPLLRHEQTAAGVSRQYHQKGQALPDAQVIEGLREIPAFGILAEHGPSLPGEASSVGGNGTEQMVPSPAEKTKIFHQQGEILRRWIDGQQYPGFQTWQQCRDIAAETLDQLCEQLGSGKRAVVFGSGGSICLMLAAVLKLECQRAWDMALVFNNASWAELRVSGSKRTLVSFNVRPHLDDASLVTLV